MARPIAIESDLKKFFIMDTELIHLNYMVSLYKLNTVALLMASLSENKAKNVGGGLFVRDAHDE